jgi:hypothetical protein
MTRGESYTLFQLEHPALPLSAQQVLVVGLLLGATGLLLVLLLFIGLLRYRLMPFFWPAVLNALLTAIVTSVVVLWLQASLSAGLIGLLIGVFIGARLCWLCGVNERTTHGKA